ncbi:craniofacial development protein 2, partial [Tanacetum coccineum]
PFGPPPPVSGGSPLLPDQDLGVGGYSQTRTVGRVASSRRIRVGSWNVGTLTGKFLELVDSLKRKKVDIACFQETKWKGSRNREGNQYKLWYSGSANARNGVGVALAPNLKDKVVQVIRISDRIMLVRLVIEEETINVISAYAPQVGLGEAEKKSFWDSLDDLVRVCSTTQQLIVAGDLNSHIGANVDGFSSVHGGFGYGVRNEEGLITFHSGDHDTQIDYMLVRKGDLRLCKDCKVFPGEEKIEGVFSVLFNGQRSDRTKEVDSIGAIPQNNCYCSRIRHTEVKEALRKMGRNKAVGRDEIPIEAWRCLGGEGVRWLTILFNKTFLRAKMPEEWRLSETLRRHMTAFHKTLSDKGTPARYIKVIQDMYEGARTCVRTPTGNTKYFPVDVGLHQGSAISPYLFALILDELMKGIQESIPWCLIFADDIVLISETPEGLNGRLE